ncbi:MAG: hypothetical protein ASARMPREDX12_002067 [Alectoria sarmentosa]|nr:MAG: hypothetical protein ASARMPREDX12_002067 [Alectoria sarmentosa]
MLLQPEKSSDPGLDLRVSGESHMSKPSDVCRSELDIQKTRFSELMGKGTRDAGVMSITKASAHPNPSHGQGENFGSPLRLELARSSVKSKIFACMDKGFKKAEIESRTGLSHRCIKWHRRLWRNEGGHPRPWSKKLSKSPARGPRSPGRRSERLLRQRPACDEEGDSSIVGEPSSDKRRRKHRAVKRSKGCSMRTGTEMPGSGGGKCAEKDTREFDSFAGKENFVERNEAMAMSGELKILPIRDLGS